MQQLVAPRVTSREVVDGRAKAEEWMTEGRNTRAKARHVQTRQAMQARRAVTHEDMEQIPEAQASGAIRDSVGDVGVGQKAGECRGGLTERKKLEGGNRTRSARRVAMERADICGNIDAQEADRCCTIGAERADVFRQLETEHDGEANQCRTSRRANPTCHSTRRQIP